ncbi:MAG: DUF1476 domain-containing protein [Rhodospirillaceae bacterium]|jgi:hypothetical protein|nr:DUF1476 domain-containing protein [Rhodospirillaceae bacterium]
MSDAFHDREKSFEAKYKLDQELDFKATARRDKLIGFWAAVKMGMSEAEARDYAMQIVRLEMDAPGGAAVVGKIIGDFGERNVKIKEKKLRAEMDRFFAIAMAQLMTDYPEALGDDHERVGD